MEVDGVLAFFFSVVLDLAGDCLLAEVVVVMRVGLVGVLILFFGVISELVPITAVEEEAEEAPVVILVAVASVLDKYK